MRALGLAIPARDARKPMRDVLDLNIKRRGVEQIEAAAGQHALPGARGGFARWFRRRSRHGSGILVWLDRRERHDGHHSQIRRDTLHDCGVFDSAGPNMKRVGVFLLMGPLFGLVMAMILTARVSLWGRSIHVSAYFLMAAYMASMLPAIVAA